jgi:hypothetical protein
MIDGILCMVQCIVQELLWTQNGEGKGKKNIMKSWRVFEKSMASLFRYTKLNKHWKIVCLI